MAMRTIECIECGTTVPYGRLSCPSCGELLASVAGSARRLTSLAPELEPVIPASRPVPAVLHDVAAEELAAAPAMAADVGDLGSLTWPTVRAEAAEVGDAADAAEVGDAARASTTPDADGADDADEAPATAPAWMTPAFPPQPTITVASPPATPGAYVPPSPPPSVPEPVIPAGRPAPARSWGAPTSDAPRTLGQGDRDEAAAAVAPSVSLTDPVRRAEAIDWIAVAGAALGSVGFLLPWARSIIGADGVGYLDTWGFAGPAHVVVVAGMLVVLGLAVATTHIPAWVRLGMPGLVLSALLIGLLWPYILGPLGALPGAYLSLAGALVLGVASVAALGTDRHARPDSGV